MLFNKKLFVGTIICSAMLSYQAQASHSLLFPISDQQENQKQILCTIPTNGPFFQDASFYVKENAHFYLKNNQDNPAVHEFLTYALGLMMAGIVEKHTLSHDDLVYKKTLSKDVLLYKDLEGANWYVRPIEHSAFEQIASVAASNIHNHLSPENDITVKFLVKGTQHNRSLIGSAFKAKDFKPFWGTATNHDVYQPKNLEREYAIWRYLGLPVPDPSFFGLNTSNEENVIRVDYHNAFSIKAAQVDVTEECFKSSMFVINENYKCKVADINKIFKEILADKNIEEIVNLCAKTLNILQIRDFEDEFQRIKEFLKGQSK